MKLRLTLALPLFVFSFVLLTTLSFAESLSLTKIGTVDTTGKKFPEWWYTVANPVLAGKAEASKEVSVVIDDKTYNATANGSGDWSVSAPMALGDRKIKITQGSESYSFTLHITQTLPASFGNVAQTTQTTTSVPSTGSDQLVALGLGLGLTLFATYLYVSGDSNKKAVFERQFIRE